MTDTSTAMALARTFFSLAVVLALIWGASRAVRRRGRALPGDPTALEVVARRGVGRRSHLLVVEVSGRRLLVGASDASLSLLADLTTAADRDPGPTDDIDTVIPNHAEPPSSRLDPVDLTTVVELPLESLDLSSHVHAPTDGSLLGSLRALTVRRP